MIPRYELGQQLEVHGLGLPAGDTYSLDGTIVTVLGLPGCLKEHPEAYAVQMKGAIVAAVEKFLRPLPPLLPKDRGDIDKVTSWPQFQKATQLSWDTVDYIRGQETGV